MSANKIISSCSNTDDDHYKSPKSDTIHNTPLKLTATSVCCTSLTLPKLKCVPKEGDMRDIVISNFYKT